MCEADVLPRELGYVCCNNYHRLVKFESVRKRWTRWTRTSRRVEAGQLVFLL
jgi:hypothetical protein